MNYKLEKTFKTLSTIVAFIFVWLIAGFIVGFGWGILIAIIGTFLFSQIWKVKDVDDYPLSMASIYSSDGVDEKTRNEVRNILSEVEEKGIVSLIANIVRYFNDLYYHPDELPKALKIITSKGTNSFDYDGEYRDLQLIFNYKDTPYKILSKSDEISFYVDSKLVYKLSGYSILDTYKSGVWIENIIELEKEFDNIENERKSVVQKERVKEIKDSLNKNF